MCKFGGAFEDNAIFVHAFTDGFKLYIHITLFMVCLFGCLLKWYNSGKSEFMLPSMIYGYQREEHITKSNYQGFDVTKWCI